MSTVCHEVAMFNGEFIAPGESRISVQSDAVMYGVGLFETMRTYHHRKMPFLTAHLERIMTSISVLNMSCRYQIEQLRNMVLDVVQHHPDHSQRVKLLAIPDGIYIQSNSFVSEQITQGIRLKSHPGKRSLPEHKTTAYLDCYHAWQSAQRSGFDDALFVDDRNEVYETSRANIFWLKDNMLYTREKGILPGIIRDFVINQSHGGVRYQDIQLEDLYLADEVFITNSIKGIVSVEQIDEQTYSSRDTAMQVAHQLTDFIAL